MTVKLTIPDLGDFDEVEVISLIDVTARQNAVMNVQAASLTDAEIRALAAFYGDDP